MHRGIRLLLSTLLLGPYAGASSVAPVELFTVRTANSSVQVRLFRWEPGRLQDLILEKNFASRQAAENFLRARGLDPRSSWQEHALPKDATVTTEASGQVIWSVRENWSTAWERRYADWLGREMDAEFFNRFRIPTDCADVAIAARWIFARMNGLPAGNTLSGSGVLFTQDSMRQAWLGLPRDADWSRDQVFRAALEYVLVNTDTHSLFQDSSPVAIDPATFAAGAYHMEFESGEAMGHTQLVNAVDFSQQSAEIGVLESTVPRDFRVLFAIAFDQLRQPVPGMGGLVRARWPEFKAGRWRLRAAEDHFDYSRAQYARDFVGDSPGFSVAVKRRLASHYDPLRDFETAIGNLRTLLQKRARIVEDGFAVCQREDCHPETTAWNEWSTPDRDGRLYDLARLLTNMRRQAGGDVKFARAWSDFLAGSEVTIEGETIGNDRLWLEVESNNLSPDPRDSIRKRWGLARD